MALSKFEVFAGFKPLSQIEPLFKLKPLQQFVPDNTSKWSDELLRDVTAKILKTDLKEVEKVQGELAKLPKSQLGDASYILELLPRLQDQYGRDDAGNLVALLLMNFMTFQAGDAIYIPADGIHAYLSGDIVECMARSNNVLNTGFCPPAERNNIDMFAQTLTFKSHSKDDVILPSQKYEKSKHGKTVVFKPALQEFDMLKADLKAGDKDEILGSEGPGVLIVTSGKGTMTAEGKNHELNEGFIYYVAPGVPVTWETDSGLQIHMAVI